MEKKDNNNKISLHSKATIHKLKFQFKDFIKFLKENSAISLAIAVVSGNAVNQFVTILVKGIITPTLELVIPKGSYETITIKVKNSEFLIGELIASIIYLIIILTIIYIFAKYITKDVSLFDKVKVKKAKIKK